MLSHQEGEAKQGKEAMYGAAFTFPSSYKDLMETGVVMVQ